MMKRSRALPLALALAVLPMAGCVEDETVRTLETAEQRLLARYVSLGNSITAGFQGLGINVNTQREAYPVLLANAADVRFNIPELALPGCPPPLAQPLAQGTGTIAPGVACALRRPIESTFPVQNLAIPGANILQAIDHLSNADTANTFNKLQTFFLGGRTQVEAMKRVDPTFVSAWLGNNDALGVLFTGVPSVSITPLVAFEGSVDKLAEAIASTPAEGAALFGVVNPLVVPTIQPGAYFFAAAKVQADGTRTFGGKPVNVNCSPLTSTGQVNQQAFTTLVSFFIVQSPVPEINCDPNFLAASGTPLVFTQAEQAAITQRVTEFNAKIESVAQQRGWIFINPNAVLGQFLDQPNRIRKCQGFGNAALSFAQAVQQTCPFPTAPNFWGSLFSFDGFHPSSEAHQVIARALAQAIDAKHGTALAAKLTN